MWVRRNNIAQNEDVKEKNMKHINQNELQRKLVGKIIGFDDLLGAICGRVEADSSFPPYNISKKGEDEYLLEIAVAGFSENELVVETKEKELNISGQQAQDEKEDVVFLHRGIATRSFKRKFILAEYMEVKSATFKNGILSIEINREVPEDKKFKTIKIGASTD